MAIQRVIGLMAAVMATRCAAVQPEQSIPRAVDAGCTALQVQFSSSVFLPGSDVYEEETKAFWSNTELMDPGCVFRPASGYEVAGAIASARKSGGHFAVRGGGHMAFPGANNIDDGVLMVMSNLTKFKVSEDKTTLTMGPGFDWGEVYSSLEAEGLAVGGGRLSPVGVPGLLLAGGVNFYGNQHGWSADQVIEYEVVLGNASIVTASATDNPDLFWALKGGSSNFGIVTSFTMRVFESPKVWAGTYSVSGDQIPELLEAIADFSAYNTDPLSHIVPMVVPMGPNTTVASVIMFYDSANVSSPACFEKILAIPSVSSTMDFKTLSEFAIETGALVVDEINDLFIAGTTVGQNYDDLLTGLQVVHDTFMDAIPSLYKAVPVANISLVSIDWQPIGSLWQEGSKKSNPTGNALGVDPAAKGTYLCWAEVVEWIGSSYDDAVMEWVVSTTDAIKKATQEAGVYDAFNYMGDAAGFEEIYPGYGPENHKRLIEISRQYDPERVFQELMPGGFKLGA